LFKNIELFTIKLGYIFPTDGSFFVLDIGGNGNFEYANCEFISRCDNEPDSELCVLDFLIFDALLNNVFGIEFVFDKLGLFDGVCGFNCASAKGDFDSSNAGSCFAEAGRDDGGCDGDCGSAEGGRGFRDGCRGSAEGGSCSAEGGSCFAEAGRDDGGCDGGFAEGGRSFSDSNIFIILPVKR